MVKIRFLELNKATGFLGIIFVSLAITLVVFSAINFVEGAGWSEAADEEGDEGYRDIGGNWYVAGVIASVTALGLLVTGAVLLAINRRGVGKSPGGGKPHSTFLYIFDLNRIEGSLAGVMIPTGLVFLVNGIFYKIEAKVWERSAEASGKMWHLREASEWHTGAMWMYLIAIFLICGAAFLLVLNWRLVKREKRSASSDGKRSELAPREEIEEAPGVPGRRPWDGPGEY